MASRPVLGTVDRNGRETMTQEVRTFFTADNHFGHEKILIYEKRPFENLHQMHREMIKRWNKTVRKADKIFVLGDFSFCNKTTTAEIVKQLNGRKFLVLGNHDEGHSVRWWRDTGFERVYDYPILFRQFFILSHEPVYLNDSMPYANLHGHLHSKKLSLKTYVNMSVENWDYTPVSFEEIKIQLSK
jgi:calcineurin-like phosphoesterase family protein